MTRRIAQIAAPLAALFALAVPAAAGAAETAFVSDLDVLTYWSDMGQVDTVTVADRSTPGTHQITETTSPSGAPGQRCTSGGVCTGATSAWLMGLDRDDTLTVDAALPSWIDGGSGADALNGSPVADTLEGGTEGDTLDGRGGADTVNGGDGADTIEARDGAIDTVDCGPGVDTVQADPADVVTNCELPAAPVDPVDPVDPIVDDLPKPGDEIGGEKKPKEIDEEPALPEPIKELSVPSVGVTQTEAKVSADGVTKLELACAATEVDGCVGKVLLDPAPKGRAKGTGKAKDKANGKAKGRPSAVAARRGRGRYGKSPFRIAAGRTKRVSVKLSRSARARLGLSSGRKARAARRGRRRVKVVVTVSQRGKAPRRQKVTLRT